MVDIHKTFSVKQLKDLEPGELISGIIDGVQSFGLTINPIAGQHNAIVFGENRRNQKVYIGFSEYFGREGVVSYGKEWSIKPVESFYGTEGRNSRCDKAGSVTITENGSSIVVSTSGSVFDDIRIDLDTLLIVRDELHNIPHVVALNWEIWLNKNVKDPDGDPLFTIEIPN